MTHVWRISPPMRGVPSSYFATLGAIRVVAVFHRRRGGEYPEARSGPARLCFRSAPEKPADKFVKILFSICGVRA